MLQIWSLYYCTFVLFLFSLLFVFFKLWTRNRGNHNAQKCIKYINKISSNRLWILNTYSSKCAFSFHLYIFLILPKIIWSIAIWNIMRFTHSHVKTTLSVHCEKENDITYKKILKIARPIFLLLWQLSGIPIKILNVELYFLCTLTIAIWWSSLS